MNWWVFVKCEPKSSQLKEPKTKNYFSLCALNLFNTRVSQFELNYWNKWTFPRHCNLFRCTCICAHLWLYAVFKLGRGRPELTPGRRGVAAGGDGGDTSPALFFDPPPIFPPTFSDLLLRCEWPNIQPITRQIISWARLPWAPAALAVSFIHFFALWRSGVKCTPEKKQRTITSFFFFF